jgi:uncharacterized membrane protein
MKEWLVLATEWTSLVINWMALLLIVIGTVEAFLGAIRAGTFGAHGNHALRLVWLRYARWLVAALTFQLSSDIIETSVTPSWDELGRLAAIAVVRTVLNYFLERDLGEIRERDEKASTR